MVDETTTRNVQSLRNVPTTHITPERRAALLARASAGQDVYAYGMDRLRANGVADLWDTDTRIPLAPVAQHVWLLQRAVATTADRWLLTFAHRTTHERVTIVVTIQHQVTADPHYTDRAGRVAQMIEQTIALYQRSPSTYDQSTF